MRPHWLIEAVNFQNDCNSAQNIVYLLEEAGIPVTTFIRDMEGKTNYNFVPQESPVVYLGTWNALVEMRDSGIHLPEPFVWCDLDLFKCSTYYARLGDLIIQKNPRFIKLKALTENTFGNSKALFIRPDDNEKSFVGQVVKKDLCLPFVKNLIEHGMIDRFLTNGDLDIVVAETQEILHEWRVVLVDGKAVTGSKYKEGPCIEISPDFPQEVSDFAEKVADRWSPHPVFIVDVGETKNGYGVMEIGPFNYAGLYRCNLRALVNSINSYVSKSY